MNLAVKSWARQLMDPPVRRLVRLGVRADQLTQAGFVFSVAAGFALGSGGHGWAAGLLLASGVCDMLDGGVARAGAGETRLGAFLDSTLDRAGESAVYVGSAWRGVVLVNEWAGTRWEVALPALALATSLLVSYVRARAEGLGADCRVGLMERTERMLLLIVAAVLATRWEAAWAIALALLTALNLVTFVQRIRHVTRELRGTPGAPGPAPKLD